MERTVDYRYAPGVVQTCIGLAGDPHKTIVREDGSLNYGYRSRTLAFIESDGAGRSERALPGNTAPERDMHGFAYRLKPVFTHTDALVDRRQDYGDPGAAIVETVEEYRDTTFRWTAFAHEDDGLRADVIRWTLDAAEDFGRAPSRVELRLDGELDGVPTIIETPGTTEHWSEDGARNQAQQNYQFLRAGDRREGAFAVVLDGDLDPATLTLGWADDARREAEEYWRNRDPFQTRFEVPDPEINALLAASGRNILQAAETTGGVTEFRVGPTEYRGAWIADGRFIHEAVHYMGRGEQAFENGLLSLLRQVRSNGAIQTIPRHSKETGIALSTIVRQCELADDDDRLAELWPTMLRALDFLEGLRAEARAMDDYPANDLFPPEYLDGGIWGPFPGYPTAFWILAGLRAARDAGARLDLEDHERFAELFDEVLAAVRLYAERDMAETEDGLTYLPMNMVDREYDRPGSATWAYAHAIYPGEVFDPDDPLVEVLLDLADATDGEQGIPATTGWIHDQGVWTYAASFYAHDFLYAGKGQKAADYLYAFANHAAPSGVWREEQSFTDTHSNEFLGDMPHNWASAEFVRLVRNLLVFEAHGGIELLPGLPEEWLPADDSPLALEATPTRFGPVTLSLERAGDGYDLAVSRGAGNREPASITLRWPGDVVDATANLDPLGDDRWSIPLDRDAFEARLRR